MEKKILENIEENIDIVNFIIDNGFELYCSECDKMKLACEFPNDEKRKSRFGKGYYCRECTNEYMKKYLSTPKQRLRHAITSGIYRSIKNEKGGASWENLINFSFNELRDHLEKRFQEGMTFENYGQWHIDHIVPVSRFDFNSPEDKEFKMCWSLNNLQPMWGDENLSKNADLCYTEDEYKEFGVQDIYMYIMYIKNFK